MFCRMFFLIYRIFRKFAKQNRMKKKRSRAFSKNKIVSNNFRSKLFIKYKQNKYYVVSTTWKPNVKNTCLCICTVPTGQKKNIKTDCLFLIRYWLFMVGRFADPNFRRDPPISRLIQFPFKRNTISSRTSKMLTLVLREEAGGWVFQFFQFVFTNARDFVCSCL